MTQPADDERERIVNSASVGNGSTGDIVPGYQRQFIRMQDARMGPDPQSG